MGKVVQEDWVQSYRHWPGLCAQSFLAGSPFSYLFSYSLLTTIKRILP
jgi:hypothetical protein